MSDHTLTVSSQTHALGATVIGVRGELDQHTAPQLHDALADAPFTPGGRVILDLAALRYCDSTGITALIAAYQLADRSGARLTLAGPREDLMRLFSVLGIDQLFVVQPTVDEAVASEGHPH
ncbi:STAS domain-containing protein [Actinacidiphila alni]|uniref:STAS domain-containing protein n=1 Tax=Actinacidiphila alni TaxID=380248 RepID=UPI0033FD2AA2